VTAASTPSLTRRRRPLVDGCIDKTVKVGVPHDQGKGATPIDSGFKYDATK